MYVIIRMIFCTRLSLTVIVLDTHDVVVLDAHNDYHNLSPPVAYLHY